MSYKTTSRKAALKSSFEAEGRLHSNCTKVADVIRDHYGAPTKGKTAGRLTHKNLALAEADIMPIIAEVYGLETAVGIGGKVGFVGDKATRSRARALKANILNQLNRDKVPKAPDYIDRIRKAVDLAVKNEVDTKILVTFLTTLAEEVEAQGDQSALAKAAKRKG